MNNVVQRVITVTPAWQSASAQSEEIATVDVLALPSNQHPVEFEGDLGQPVPWQPGEWHAFPSGGAADAATVPEVPWQPGEWHAFPRINLAHLRVRGQPGYQITVVGGSW